MSVDMLVLYLNRGGGILAEECGFIYEYAIDGY